MSKQVLDIYALNDPQMQKLISVSLTMMSTIVDVAGATAGHQMWEVFADAIDPNLKNELLLRLLKGEQTKVYIKNYIAGTISGTNPNLFINEIKVIREHSGLGLKEAKDIMDAVRAGGVQEVKIIDHTRRMEMINDIKSCGYDAF